MTDVPTAALVAQLAGIIAATDKLPAQNNRLVEDLGFDSFDKIEFHIFLEDEFGIDFGEEDEASIRTIADATAIVERELKKKRRVA